MMGMEQLSALLDKQIETQNKLLDLEKQKTTIITHGNIDELDELLKLEQPLVMYSTNLERQRETLQHDMGLGKVSLKDIIKENDLDEDCMLESRFKELKKTVENLKKTVHINTAILHKRMYVIDQVLSFTGIEDSGGIYTKEGHL